MRPASGGADMDRLSQEQQRRNAESAMAWTLYSPHRERVTQILLDARSPSATRLCLLGAGNLNDFYLPLLMSVFQELVLVDIDADAVQRGLTQQGFARDERIQIFAPTDLTGIYAELSSITLGQPASGELIERCLDTLRQPPNLFLETPCDVVASVGLLTQLIDAVSKTVGDSHPRFWDVVSAVRLQHLLLMLGLTKTGGAAVLVTEVVSTDSCPALNAVGVAGLESLLLKTIADRNFFTGTNPAALHQLLKTEPRLAMQLARIEFSTPWLWPFIARTYAVYAVILRK